MPKSKNPKSRRLSPDESKVNKFNEIDGVVPEDPKKPNPEKGQNVIDNPKYDKGFKAPSQKLGSPIEAPGTSALVHGIEQPLVTKEVNAEQKQQELLNMFQELVKNPRNTAPFIFGTDTDGNLKIAKLEKDKEGSFILPDAKSWTAPSRWDLIRKKRKVNKIMKFIDPILRRDISHVASISFMRKSDDVLDRLLAKLKDKKERHHVGLVNRLSCVYVETDDETIVL